MALFNTIRISALFALPILAAGLVPLSGASAQEGGAYSSLVARHAAAHGLPPSLVHRVIMRESRYNPRAVSKGNYGMMQIRLGTARAMGYSGGAAGLLDANTNMTYAVKYLAGAYRAAGGNHDRAVALYARGYHDVARRQGTSAVALASASASPFPAMSREVRRARGEEYASARPARRGHYAAQVTTTRDHEVR
jgi:soluble lytic murein transglycosylase-like protein